MDLLYLFLGLVYTTFAQNVKPITHWLDEKSGYCKPDHWYSMGPCQQCYCRESNRLVCNGNDQFAPSEIQFGSEKLTLCLTDLKKETDMILSEIDPVPSLRNNPLTSGDVSSEEKQPNPVKKEKEGVEAKSHSAQMSDSGSDRSRESTNIRMPLSYPSINDAPKMDHEDSDDSSRSEEEDSRKFLTRKQSADKYEVGVKIKGDMTQTDDQTIEGTLPKEMVKMMFDALAKGNMNLGNLMPKMNAYRKAAAVSTRDYVLAYILL